MAEGLEAFSEALLRSARRRLTRRERRYPPPKSVGAVARKLRRPSRWRPLEQVMWRRPPLGTPRVFVRETNGRSTIRILEPGSFWILLAPDPR